MLEKTRNFPTIDASERSLLAKMNFGNLTDYDYLVASYQELIGPLK
jgi:hypothetical protein